MKILLTDAHLCSSLAVLRSFGRRRLNIVVSSHKRWAIGFFSKYKKDSFIYPSPEKAPSKFIKTLANEARKRGCDMLFPLSDATLLLVSMYRDEFKGINIPIPSHSIVENALNKRHILSLAKKKGVPVPKEYNLDEFSLPCVIKSSYACYFDGVEMRKVSPVFVNEEKEFFEEYKRMAKIIPNPIIQEYIKGEGCGVFLLMDKEGRTKAAFMHKRIREIDPKGSASCFCKSSKLDERLLLYSESILKELGWWGPAMVEFKIREDGAAFLMEVNPRFWGSLPLSIAAGVDFPWLFLLLLEGKEFCLPAYKEGVKARYLRGELLHLLRVLKGHPWLPYPSKRKTFATFFKEFLFCVNYYNFSFSDPLPGIVDIMEFFLEDLLSSFRRRIAL